MIDWIDTLNRRLGRAVSWMTLMLVLITIYDILMRYVFKAGSVWIQEAEWHLFAANFMLASGWTLLRGGHVRVDLLYNRFSPRMQAVVDLLGTLLFLFPFCAVVIWASIPYVMDSWAMWEGSSDPGGLPGRFLLKTTIPVTFFMIALQGVSMFAKNLKILTTHGKQS
ncbi:TRAP transporter small permease subunit [Desulfobacula sp.]|uniref:TRAP transporter small permease subunit n=1 Tax=Desulfobacula sp. TaxID=2593537 RepID=UPI00261380D5|nr:TRAP transporter small permease subunit [Desulfobacula sp.]